MNNPACWRQPTPTDINGNPNLTILDKCVFREILSYCRNEDGVENFIHANRHYSVELKRGQCIFKIAKFAKGLGIDKRTVTKSLVRLSKWYSRMPFKGMPYGCIVTMESYDEIIDMHNGMHNGSTIEVQQKYNRGTANKSVKTVKTVKNVKKNTYTPSKEGLEVIKAWNDVMKTEFVSPRQFESNLFYHLESYSMKDIKKAIGNIPKSEYWRNDITPVVFFRRKDKHGEDLDRISEFLKYSKRKLTADENFARRFPGVKV